MSQVLDHRLALIERGLQLLPDTLRGLIGRLASLLGGVSRYLQEGMWGSSVSPVSPSRREGSLADGWVRRRI